MANYPAVTRETLPRFDLYGELEVSPFASVGTIEAAYRVLVKQHHPDVASGDEGRMRRLNLAREWLTDRELRHRYDQETDRGRHITDARRPVATHSVVTRSHAERRAAGGWPPAGSAGSRDAEPSFGIHADEVRQFLAELRSLDRARAQRVWNGRAVAHTRGYTQALRAAASAVRGERKAEWQFAREAASVIARGKLGDSTLSDQVADVLSDAAGAIAIRDLLSPGEFSLVLMPWTWRGTVRLPEMEAPPQAAPSAAQTGVAATPAVEDRSSLDNLRSLEIPMPGLKSEASFAAKLAASKAAEPLKPAAAGPTPVPATAAIMAPPASPAPPVRPAMRAAPPPPAVAAAAAAAAPLVAAAAPAPPPKPATPAKLATPFIAAAPPSSVPPIWPAQPEEPRARPPVDPAIPARLAAALAANPVPSSAKQATAANWKATTRPASTSIRRREPVRAAVFAPPPRRRIGTFPMALAGASIVLIIGSALLMFPGIKPSQEVAAATDAPTDTVPGVALGSEAPPTVDPSAGSTDQPPASTEPTTTGGGAGPTPLPPGPGSTPRPRTTPRPTRPGSTPTPPATPTPTPPPTPTPIPPPTPPTTCTVPNLINVNSANALAVWGPAIGGAGFTGPITYNPTIPPQYKIAWQSLAAGTDLPCTSGIEVRKTAP